MGPSILLGALWITLAADEGASAVVHATVPVQRTLVGDWAPVDAVLVAASESWPDTLAPLLSSLATRTHAHLLVQNGSSAGRVDRFVAGFGAAERANLHRLPLTVDSPWVRDYGPLQVRTRSGEVTWLDAEYAERRLDDAIPAALARHFGVAIETLPWSLDGGALASDGAGLCLSTFEYFQTHAIPRAGPILQRELMPAIGCTTLVFVPGLRDEDTGHVDLLAQFLSPEAVMIATIDAGLDPDESRRLDATAEAIVDAAGDLGRELAIVRVPLGVGVGGELYTYINGLRVGD